MKMPRWHSSTAGKNITSGIPSALFGSALLIAAIGCRQYLELTMTRHMLAQIPMLLIAGAAFSHSLARMSWGRSCIRHMGTWDENGLAGLLAFMLATAFWMIPKALDGAIASTAMEQGKILSLLAAGFLLPAALKRANLVIQLFFLGNFASMMAVVGMLYQDAPKRLCNFYLTDDQVVAGIGLVTLAIVLPLLWCLRTEAVRNWFKGTPQSPAPVPADPQR